MVAEMSLGAQDLLGGCVFCLAVDEASAGVWRLWPSWWVIGNGGLIGIWTGLLPADVEGDA